jgi:hypothetical protein
MKSVNLHREDLKMERVICVVTFLALAAAVSPIHAQGVGDPEEGLPEVLANTPTMAEFVLGYETSF